MEITGQLVRELLARLHDGPLEEQLLGVLSAVTEMGGAYVVVPPTRGVVDMQQICHVQQNRVQGVDPYTSSHQQQIHRGVSGRWVEEEVPADTHGHVGAQCTRGMNPMCRGVFTVFDSQFNDSLPLQQTRAGAHGETSHLLYTRNEEVHPLSCFEAEVWMDGYSQAFDCF